MSEEPNKYITKIIKTEETTTGDGGKVEVEVEYLIKDSGARESITEINGKIGNIKDIKGNTISENLSNINKKIGDETIEDGSISNNINTIKRDINAIGENIDTIEGDINTIKTKIGNETIEDGSISNNINTIKTKIGNETIDGSISENLSNINEKIGDETIEDGSISNNINTIKGDINDIEENIDTIKTKIGNETIENGSISNNINTIKTKIGNETIEDGSISNNINTIKTKVGNETIEDGSISNNINTIKENINAIEENIDTINWDKLSKIQTKTYSELVELRDNEELIPGQEYRIIDYVTTTSQENTVSAKHQFDIIVEALTGNTLSENAKACLHSGDTYFSKQKLEAWELKYCLDNDLSRFRWALPERIITSSGGLTIHGQDIKRGSESELERFLVAVLMFGVDSFGEIYGYSYPSEQQNITISSFGKIMSPDSSPNQLCLYPKDDENTAYFYYGKLEDYNDPLFDKFPEIKKKSNCKCWRKAKKVESNWVWDVTDDSSHFIIVNELTIVDVGSESTSNNEFLFSLDLLLRGKGVIYYMKDEFGNECPYDFKNIKFKIPESIHNNDDTYYFTFTYRDTENTVCDATLVGDNATSFACNNSINYTTDYSTNKEDDKIQYHHQPIKLNTTIIISNLILDNTIKINTSTGTNSVYLSSAEVRWNIFDNVRSTVLISSNYIVENNISNSSVKILDSYAGSYGYFNIIHTIVSNNIKNSNVWYNTERNLGIKNEPTDSSGVWVSNKSVFNIGENIFFSSNDISNSWVDVNSTFVRNANDTEFLFLPIYMENCYIKGGSSSVDCYLNFFSANVFSDKSTLSYNYYTVGNYIINLSPVPTGNVNVGGNIKMTYYTRVLNTDYNKKDAGFKLTFKYLYLLNSSDETGNNTGEYTEYYLLNKLGLR